MEKDVVLKEYEEDPVHFCDLINGILAEGRQLIKPEQLRPMPTEVTGIRETEKKSDARAIRTARTVRTVQRFRDLTRRVVAADGKGYVIIALQNQAKVDYSMPIREMTEDALEYDAQVRLLRGEKLHSGEKLMGVFTLTLYHGPDEWTEPMELRELVQLPEQFQELEQYLQNYRMIFASPRTVKPENFKTGWREVFEILKRQSKKQEMKKYLQEHREQLRALPEDTNRLIFVLTNQQAYYEEFIKKGEKPEMCQAFEDYREEGREEGRAVGRAEGNAEGELLSEKRMVTKMFRDRKKPEEVMPYVTVLTRENLQELYAAATQKA